MKGKFHITIQNNRIHYEFDIRRNITVIRGDSATGKTTLYQMIDQVTRLGQNAGIELVCEKTCRTLPASDWKLILSSLHEQIIFIDEDSEYIRTHEFAEAIKGADNYFVLITRENLPNLPYSVDEVYGIHQSGRYHDLRKTYNEFYRIYDAVHDTRKIQPQVIVTEDSNAGYTFYKTICDGRKLLCKSAGGKSNLVKVLRKICSSGHRSEEILAVGDGAAIGPEMADLDLLLKKEKNLHLFLPESFEWLVLKSGLIDGRQVTEILNHPEDYADSIRYFSWEQFFTELLIRETEGTYLQYRKTVLNPAYCHKKEMAAIMEAMPGVDFSEQGNDT